MLLHLRRCVATLALIAGTLALTTAALAGPPAGEDDQVFYALGVIFESRLAQFDLTKEEAQMVIQGLSDAISGDTGEFDINVVGPRIDGLREARSERLTEKEKVRAVEMLKAAAAEKGAIRTESGLVYRAIKVGKGDSPSATDTVKVHYHGTLSDGTVFDSSVDRGEPIDLPLNRVIKCWTEGLGRMKPGGKSKLTCPSDIAYGERGSPPRIPGGAALAFEVELIEIVSKGE
jgi:FKBP-type peptidyl-prolyl cis-trans isomerase FkpA